MEWHQGDYIFADRRDAEKLPSRQPAGEPRSASCSDAGPPPDRALNGYFARIIKKKGKQVS
jgi:hypothetical protein